MPTVFKRPGAFVEDVILPQQIQSLGLDIAVGAFVGAAERGPVTAPVFTSTWSEFSRQFGGFKRADGTVYPLAYAVYMFFANNGRGCWINRVPSTSAVSATVTLADATPTNVLTVTAANPGDWALASATSGVSLVVEDQTLTSAIQIAARNGSNVLTVTTTNVNTFSVGDMVKIIGLAMTGGNVETPVLSVIDGKNFTVASVGSTATEGSTSSPTAGSVSPSNGLFSLSVLLGGTTNGYLVEKFSDLVLNPAGERFAPTVITANSQYVTASVASGFVAPQVNGVNVYHSPATNQGIPIGLGRPQVPTVTTISATPTLASWTGGTATVTAANTFVVGDVVTVTGITVNGLTSSYDGTFTITARTSTTFAYATTDPGAGTLAYTGAAAVAQRTTYATAVGSLDGAALTSAELVAAVSRLDPLTPNLVVNVPDSAYLSEPDAQKVNTAYLAAMDARGDSFLVMGTGKGLLPSEAIAWAADVTPKSNNGAIYYPWLVIADPAATQGGATRTVPPGGAVVGLYLATDAARGAWKAPAGVGASLSNVVALERTLLSSELDSLNTALTPVNALRPVPGAGICVMGSRTVSTDRTFRYVNTRRALLQIKKRLLDATQFAIFEGNDSRLWERLRTVCTTYLNGVWQSGGLKGGKASDAFYVICDASNNTTQTIADGQVIIEVGVALQVPAEFVVIRIGQFEGGNTASI